MAYLLYQVGRFDFYPGQVASTKRGLHLTAVERFHNAAIATFLNAGFI
jgi:hypothetical protein